MYTCYIICILFVFTLFPGVNLSKELTPPAEVFGSHLLHPSPAAASFSKGKLCQVVYRQLPNTQGLVRMNLGTSPPSNNTNAKHIIRFVFFSVYLYTTNHKRSQSPSVFVQDPFLYHKHSPSVVTLPREHPSHGAKEEIPLARSLIGRAKFTLQKQWNKCSNTEKTHDERYRFCTVHGTLFGTWQTHIPVVMPSCHLCTYVVGGFNPSEKYESQLGWLFPIYGKTKAMFQTTNQISILMKPTYIYNYIYMLGWAFGFSSPKLCHDRKSASDVFWEGPRIEEYCA